MLSIFIITAFLFIIAIGIILLVLVYQKRQVQYIAEKKQLTITYEKELLESRLEIQEHTFKNISQELHDNIGQMLTLVKLNVNTMSAHDAIALQNKIDNSRQLLTKAIQDIRDLSRSLHTDHIQSIGISKAIEHELEALRKTGVYTISYNVAGDPYSFYNQEELILFRIVQESLHNIVKHSKATTIKVTISFTADALMLEIQDNGAGFDIQSKQALEDDTTGLGIKNMKNRAKLINAYYNLTSEVSKGTLLTLVLSKNINKSKPVHLNNMQ